ncbi:F0F1 ATP synthase subunit gamma [Nodularia spumigena CS-584]|jgi:F-type H+-transporting ATPase subunit gamma|uniref:ATP synthase gamma chain n=2 Tax=Nodularia spumigena TaxID=70799 RepID=A0A2S0Q5E7_NODSP|nr:F0F1 ATP synthase subunit gamma [Nodularia spumigena]AHJ26786.1 ATP synthase gamma chain [Nodularia spumigena CCY9414]AVZ29510.1 ATP synthase gamma chain [Nodularia spumigena UHCC 0039]EAW45280.1 ATP synthase gamma subunit-like protein [Nodularia spumigena CCY9414]MDB9361562.1 F0F1 ATP synthase subunit gamma [Nodularia spumigena CS-588/02]MDB9366614.1 F0F1 ATP synthase subunit gamma [Nodularia spumigena CS-588/02A10]
MPTIELLRAKIGSVQDLQSVVKTMKALAAVSIRQYQTAVESLADYNRTIEMGLQIVLRQRYFSEQRGILASANTSKSYNSFGVIIFGSDQGLCGQFNEQIANFAVEQLNDLQPKHIKIVAVGARLILPLEASGKTITEQFSVPNSVTEITAMVQEILLKIEQWQTQQQVEQIVLFYNKSLSGASYRPTNLRLLPVDPNWLKNLEKKAWSTPVLPTFTMDENQLFSALIRQYLFISLYLALAESLASENASRLSSMQAAEKNIEERLSDFNADYRRQRQSSITAELLDIVSGFEALTQPQR